MIPGLKTHSSLAHSLSYLTSYLCVLGHLIALKFCLRVCFWGDTNQDTRKRSDDFKERVWVVMRGPNGILQLIRSTHQSHWRSGFTHNSVFCLKSGDRRQWGSSILFRTLITSWNGIWIESDTHHTILPTSSCLLKLLLPLMMTSEWEELCMGGRAHRMCSSSSWLIYVRDASSHQPHSLTYLAFSFSY